MNLEKARKLARRVETGDVPVDNPRIGDAIADDLAECVFQLADEVERLERVIAALEKKNARER